MRAVILGFILIRCFVNGHASEQAAIATRSPNAALSYLQAFAALPQFDADESDFLDGFLQEEALSDTRDWRAGSIEEYQSIIPRAAASLLLLRRGARIQQCHWDLATEEGHFMPIPYVQSARRLVKIACLKVIHECTLPQSTTVDDLDACLALAAHIETEPFIVTQLLAVSIEHVTLNALIVALPQLDRAHIEAIEKRIAVMPKRKGAKLVFSADTRHMLQWFRRTVLSEPSSERRQEKLLSLAKSAWRVMTPEDEGRLARVAANRDLLTTAFLQAKKIGIEGETLYDLPWEAGAFEAAAVRWRGRLEAGGPLASLLIPPRIDTHRRYVDVAAVRLAAVHAMVRVVLSGEKSLAECKDPVLGQPFEYRSREGGFELRSAAIGNSATVVVRLGRGITVVTPSES